MKVGIIGGGAAGFFAAIHVKKNYPEAQVIILEKSHKLLSKVSVSGGGRCNVTNACQSIPELCKAYPRGGKSLKKLFHIFNTKHAFEWFENNGVPLVIQNDNCVFPASQSAQSIIDCFIEEARSLQISIEKGLGVETIIPKENGIKLEYNDYKIKPELFDKVIVTTGGSPTELGLIWLEEIGHKIELPVPSLFTFNLKNTAITELPGLVVEQASVNIQGTKHKASGALLITHWGMSGPAILKLSSYAARDLSELNYSCTIQVNWTGENNYDQVITELQTITQQNPQKNVGNFRPYNLQDRLWKFVLNKCEIDSSKKWAELGKKQKNRLANCLTNDDYTVSGKSTNADEFVTCGGVSLESVNIKSLQSKTCKNLYFAGEVLDIDAITGGFNLQAAWTTAFVAAQLKD